MSLQSEFVLDHDVLQGLPPALLGEALPRTGMISRLLFESLDAVRKEEPPLTRYVDHAEAMDGLQMQIAALEAEIQRQALERCDALEQERRAARSEARLEWETELDERLTVEHELVLLTCARFCGERERYFASVEGEVVKLSLAIAQRVLHREAAIDPLLLTAAARVALEKVRGESGVMLRVPVADEALWKQSSVVAMAGVELVADKRLATGECVIETSAGCVELGVGAQLAEIEQGFFDLLQRRPA